MNEYKVVIKIFDNRGILPDFFGTEKVGYEKAESAKNLQKAVEDAMEKEFGHETAITYTVKIERM